MGLLTRQPDLHRIIKELEDRVRYLERTRRLTVTTVKDYTHAPVMAQSGDLMVDASTGFLYIFMISGTTTTTASLTLGIPSPLFSVQNVLGFRRGNLVAVTVGSTDYQFKIQQVNGSNNPTNASGPGTILGFFYNSFNIPSPVPTPPIGTVFPAGTVMQARSWRQIMTASQLYRQGTIGEFTMAGAGSYPGDTLGGVGEVLGQGYPPST